MTTRIYTLANQKGGVGKTTTAINLGACLAAAGKTVLLIDVDPQANATSSLGYDKNKINPSIYDAIVGETPLDQVVIVGRCRGLDVVPASLALAGAEVELVNMIARERRLERALRPLAPFYDYILLDCPPSLGLLTVNALTAARGVLIPLQCEYLALEGLTHLHRTIRLIRDGLNPNLRVFGVLMTMFDPRLNLAQQVVDEVRRHFPREAFETIIPRTVRLSEAPSFGKTILEYDPAGRGAQAYQALAEEVIARG